MKLFIFLLFTVAVETFAQIFVPFGFWTPSTSWNPLQLGSNLSVWLDASDPITIRTGVAGISQANNGDLVTQWNDKSGNNNHVAQSVGGREPTYNENAWTGGKPTIVFNSTTSSLVISGLTWTNYSIALVIKHNSTTSVRALMTKRSAVSANFFWFTFTGNTIYWDQGTTANRMNTGFAPNTTTNYIYILDRPLNPASRSYFTNGTLTASSATNPNDTNTQVLYIGNDYSAANRGVDSFISEVLVINTELTTDQRQKVEGYLAWKWDSSDNLPIAHPYKLAPP